ncbi:hypothetical protein K474DRAFT_1671108 [Panus rudis PR-1116 ss-1]|nr:hypothetical protein K474DRAFT_1671108 [Panus rudis PR-1116 ss-1]
MALGSTPLMVESNEDDIDLETLQAQIDLSLAHTKDVVSTWLRPKYGDASTKPRNDDKELAELLKRPPRLGVGAPTPVSTGNLGHETLKLKSKLAGNKRMREEAKDARISEDEEESKAGAIKKRARVDPFGPKEKKKQCKGGQTNAHGVLSQTEQFVDVDRPKLGPTTKRDHTQSLPSQPFDRREQAGNANKKKKGKQDKGLTDQSDSLPNASTEIKKEVQTPVANGGTPVNAPSGPDADRNDGQHVSLAVSPSQHAHHAKLSPASFPPSPSKDRPYSLVQALGGVPLLNLYGPPPEHAQQPSPKKKRKRKKRKNQDQNGGHKGLE